MFFAVLLALLGVVCSTNLDRWYMQTSSKVSASGAKISSTDYHPKDWHSVDVPATVMAGLVADNTYHDPFYGTNLKKITSGPFNVPWWYRTTFTVEAATPETSTVTLLFEGINYRADVWYNGHLIGKKEDIVGPFTYFEFDVTHLTKRGKENALALAITRPHDLGWPPENNSTDLAISMYDWCPVPPDQNMGIWRDVKLRLSGPVIVQYPMVETKLPPGRTDFANVTVMIELKNWADTDVEGELVLTLPTLTNTELARKVKLKAKQTLEVFYLPSEYSQLRVHNPALWWPWQMGSPVLHKLTACFIQGGGALTKPSSCVKDVDFGLREFKSTLTERKYRLFWVNHQPFVIVGAGWAPDMFQRHSEHTYEKHLVYARDMNMNTIRMEGKMEADSFFNIASKLGMMTMPGWGCCDAWMHWKHWKEEQYRIAYASLHSQIKRLRIHPSIMMWFIGSDQPPPTPILEKYLQILHEEHWPNPYLACADNYTTILGPTGVKQSGPYAYVTPNYWLEAAHRRPITQMGPPIEKGGAFSDLIEGGPGASPMAYDSWKITVPAKDLWPINDVWSWHTGYSKGIFHNLRYFIPPVNARYGESKNAREFLYKAQAQAYESHKAMFEAFSMLRFYSTGVIQWMLNSPWPSHMWHLYDYYFNAGGSYFGTKTALSELQAMYSYQNHSVAIVNSVYRTSFTINKILLNVYDMLTGEVVWSVTLTDVKHIAKYGTIWLHDVIIPHTHKTLHHLTSDVFYVRFTIDAVEDETHKPYTSRNEYWLSTKPDVVDWKNFTWWVTFDSSYANFHPLAKLAPVSLDLHWDVVVPGELVATIKNPHQDRTAFLVSLGVFNSENGERILPAVFSNNWFTLIPGEEMKINVKFEERAPAPRKVHLAYETYNGVVGGTPNQA